MKLIVIIPAYNEEKNIGSVIKKCKAYSNEIIVIDDGSKDNTFKVAEKEGALVLRHRINLGKGAALKTGCDAALLKKTESIVILDSDGQHDPDEVPSFLEKLRDNDIVFSRRVKRDNMPFVAKIGNDFFSFVSRTLFGVKLNDPQSGFRAFTSDCYRKIRWDSSGYSVENEIIAKVGVKKLKYVEIPIKTIYKDNYKGTTVIDGISILFDMVMLKLVSRKWS